MEKQTDLLGGVVVSAEDPTLGVFLDGWLRDVVEPSVARNTYLKRASCVRVHLSAIGHVKLSELEPRRIHALYSRLLRREPPLSYATRREVHVTLNMALKQAVRWSLLKRNVAEMVEPPKGPAPQEDEEDAGEVRALTDEQAREFFASTAEANKRWRHYYVAAIRTGLRPGELLGLRWGDIDLDADPGSLKVRRTLDTHNGVRFNPPESNAARRTLALHWEASEAFAAQKSMLAAEGLPTGPRALVFPSSTGTPMKSDNLRNRYLKPDLRRTGLPELTLHELRHTYASIALFEWRFPPAVVQEALGHESIKMTMDLYGHLFPGSQEVAIRALRDAHRQSPRTPDWEDVAVGWLSQEGAGRPKSA